MKKYILFVIFFNSVASLFSQEEGFSQNLKVQIYVRDFKAANQSLRKLIDSTKVKLISYSEGNTSYSILKNADISLACDKANYDIFDQFFPKIGYVSSKTLKTTNNTNDINRLKNEFAFLKKKKEAYELELQKMDRKEDQQYSNFWDKIRDIEDQIHKTEQSIEEKQMHTSHYTISVLLNEDSGSPGSSSGKVQFVNMPGAQYIYLMIENPKNEISANTYHGGTVKYMFTKGKSALEFGVLKNLSSLKEDTAAFAELFIYNFGQDFYPRYFGRGIRKFLNLYTGYHIGGVFATSNTRSKHFFEVTPHIGLELFKNKYLLLDSKVGYFIPISEKYNRNMRGFTASVSLNFLF